VELEVWPWQAVVISKVMLNDVVFKFAPISVVPMLAFGLAMHFACAGGGGGGERAGPSGSTEGMEFAHMPSSLTNSLKLVLGQVGLWSHALTLKAPLFCRRRRCWRRQCVPLRLLSLQHRKRCLRHARGLAHGGDGIGTGVVRDH
jgi:hypothetical protein